MMKSATNNRLNEMTGEEIARELRYYGQINFIEKWLYRPWRDACTQRFLELISQDKIKLFAERDVDYR